MISWEYLIGAFGLGFLISFIIFSFVYGSKAALQSREYMELFHHLQEARGQIESLSALNRNQASYLRGKIASVDNSMPIMSTVVTVLPKQDFKNKL